MPDWRWEAYDKEDDGLYFGRVKSPNTYDRWEWGYFSEGQLRTAIAYRTDTETGEPYPDGGELIDEELSRFYETELEGQTYKPRGEDEG